MGLNEITKLCHTVAKLHPRMEEMCLSGHCYEFALILKAAFPGGEIVYSHTEGHAYYFYREYWYDIRGKHSKEPDCCETLCHQSGHKPHRWSKGSNWEIVKKIKKNVVSIAPCLDAAQSLRNIADQIERGELPNEATVVCGTEVFHAGQVSDAKAASDAVFNLNLGIQKLMIGALGGGER